MRSERSSTKTVRSTPEWDVSNHKSITEELEKKKCKGRKGQGTGCVRSVNISRFEVKDRGVEPFGGHETNVRWRYEVCCLHGRSSLGRFSSPRGTHKGKGLPNVRTRTDNGSQIFVNEVDKTHQNINKYLPPNQVTVNREE